MKKILTTLLAIGMITMAIGQVPQKFKYQSVVRDGNGNILPSANIAIRLSVQEDQPGGQSVYWERHLAPTNQFGVVDLEFGDGGVLSGGIWDSITWGNNNYYLGVDIDPTGGTQYISMGSSQLVSVPYAMFAEDDGDWNISHDTTQVKAAQDWTYTDGHVGIGFASPTAEPKAWLSVGNAAAQEDDLLQVGWDADHRIRLDDSAKMHHRYFGPGDNAWIAKGTTPQAMYYIENQENSGVGVIGLEALVTAGNANSHSCGVKGSNYGDGNGVFGKSYSFAGIGVKGLNTMSSNIGELGTFDHGVYGENTNGNKGSIGNAGSGVYGENTNGNKGRIGGNNYGVYGVHNSSDYEGYLGQMNEGVGGRLAYTFNLFPQPGDCGVHGYGANGQFFQPNEGTGIAYGETICGVIGNHNRDTTYYFGVAGYTDHDGGMTGGVLGSDSEGDVWGSLAFADGQMVEWAGYFQGDVLVNGDLYAPLLPSGTGATVKYDNLTSMFYWESSSMHYKENINTLEDDFSKLLTINPKTYTRTNNPGMEEIGYIAEEFEAAGLNKLVWYNKDGKPEGINYDKIVLYTNENVKDQNERIIVLEDEIKRLKEDIEILKEIR